jgi:hypothetical protein
VPLQEESKAKKQRCQGWGTTEGRLPDKVGAGGRRRLQLKIETKKESGDVKSPLQEAEMGTMYVRLQLGFKNTRLRSGRG